MVFKHNPHVAEEDSKKTHLEQDAFGDYMSWKMFEHRIIPIYYDIYEELTEAVCTELRVMAMENKNPITIEMYTHGGSVFAGMAIYDEILATRKKGIPVNIVAKGLVASMGVIILQAGTKRFATENSRIMIHEMMQIMTQQKTTSEMREKAEEMEKITETLLNILAKRMKMTKKKVQDIIKKKDVWYTAEEAKKYGLIDEVIKL